MARLPSMGRVFRLLGEMMKLQLTRLLLGRYNILLMDEPSNFLDLPAVEALETMMKGYAGTILFVSHDTRLVENVATMIYEIMPDPCRAGTLSGAVRAKGEQHRCESLHVRRQQPILQ